MITNISDRAMLVGLSIKQFSPTKTDKQLNAELAEKHGQDANMTRVAKSLIGREHLDAIRSMAGAIREEHYRRTLPWSDDGSRILTAQGYADDIRTRFKATYKGRTLGWYDTWEEAEEAIEIEMERIDAEVL